MVDGKLRSLPAIAHSKKAPVRALGAYKDFLTLLNSPVVTSNLVYSP